MPEELLDRVMREIRERRARAQAAWEESRQLERALQALEGQQDRPAAPRPARPQRARRPRAARGQTREAVLRVVSQRPGVSAAEVAAVAGLERGLIQTTLGRLVRQDEVERFALPSGSSGYRLPSPTPPAAPSNDESGVAVEQLEADATDGDVSAAESPDGDTRPDDEGSASGARDLEQAS